MKILFHSNAPWVPSAYGQQTALWVPLLASLGHEITISSYYGLQGSPLSWNGFTVLPASQHPYGADQLPERMHREKADLLITLMDAWAVEPIALKNLHTAHWMPVDCYSRIYGTGALDRGALSISGATPIALSRYGQGRLKAAGSNPLYVPHGLDMEIWKPSEYASAAREIQGLGDAFIIGMNVVNKDPFRKCMDVQLSAFARLHEKHPDTKLMLHSRVKEETFDLLPLINELGLTDRSVVFSDQYEYEHGTVGQPELALWYSLLDLYSCCSLGEGFGVPILEAQACGTPVVVNDFGAMAEIGAEGWKVRSQRWWNWSHEAWWYRPMEDQLLRAYESAYQRGPAYQKKKAQARPFAASYDAQHVLHEYWKPVLDELEANKSIVEADGLRWDVSGGLPGATGDWIGPSHEENLTGVVLSLLPAGGVLLDVGAHVGHYTLRAAQKAARVIAIEPHPDTAAHLKRNLGLNGISNVLVHEVAAWDGPELLGATSPNGQIRDGSMRVLESEDGTIQGLPLDVILVGESRIDLLKLDVEGADLRALEGLRETIARCQPVMFVEDHSIYGYYAREDLLSLISSMNYTADDGGHYGNASYYICRPAGRTIGG